MNLFFSFIADHDDYDVEYLKCGEPFGESLSLTTVPTQLASSVCKIVEVELCGIDLTKRQHLYLFKAIGQSSDLKLKKLVLCKLLLDRVDPETVALAVTNVEEIILIRVQLLSTYEAIFRAISQSEPKLKKLAIHNNYYIMDWVRDVDSMAKAVCKVQHVALDMCELTSNQLEAMFTNIATSIDLKLQNLEISFSGECSDVSGVFPEVLASAVCRLKRCNLFNSGITPEQVEELCKEIVNCKNLQLSHLNIGNMSDLEDVEKDILASAVVRLEVVEMLELEAQLHAILNKVVEFPDSKLKELYLEYVDEEDPETRSLLMKVKDKMKIYKVGNWCSSTDSSWKQVIV